jgi:hypothetical protein
MGIPTSTSMVTMTCSNTAVAPGIPLVPVKQYDRPKIKKTTITILGGIQNGKLSNLNNEQGGNTPSSERLILLR